MAVMDKKLHNNWSHLPSHKPDSDLWDRIETELDLESLTSHIGELPDYSPKSGLWKSIYFKLSLNQYLSYVSFAGIISLIAIIAFLLSNESKPSDSGKINVRNNTQSTLIQPETSAQKIKNNTSVSIPENRGAKEPDVLAEISVTNNQSLLKPDKQSPSSNNSTAINNVSTNNSPAKHNLTRKAITYPPADERKIQPSKSTQNEDLNKNIEGYTNTQKSKLSQAGADSFSKSVTVTEKTGTKQSEEEIKSQEITQKPAIEEQEEIKIETKKEDTDEAPPVRKEFKTERSRERKEFSTLGVDYTYFKYYNAENGSVETQNSFNQFGLTYKYHFANLFFQTGLNYNQFKRFSSYNSLQQLNSFKTYNYVDSVIYNQQGEIIEYITHPVIINDSTIYEHHIKAQHKYSVLSFPLLTGVYKDFGKIRLAFKAGMLCSVVIYENEGLSLPENPNIKVLKIYPTQVSVNNFRLAGVVAGEIDWNINNHWGVSAEPVLQYYFKPLYKPTDAIPVLTKEKPYSIGLKLGIFYKF